IETVVGNEFEGQQYIKQKYKEIGLDVHEFEPCKEELMRHEAFVDSGISFTNRNNIIGIHKGQGDGKSLTLHGHMDVVSADRSRIGQSTLGVGKLKDINCTEEVQPI